MEPIGSVPAAAIGPSSSRSSSSVYPLARCLGISSAGPGSARSRRAAGPAGPRARLARGGSVSPRGARAVGQVVEAYEAGVQPLGVRVPGGQGRLDVGVFEDAVAAGVGEEDPARL